MLDSIKKVYIEPTSKCNFSCKMCFRNSWFDETFLDMPFELFEKAISGIPSSVETIVFGGMGEPLFHPQLFEMIARCKEKSFKVEIITNGFFLNEETIQKILNLHVNKLWISLDSLNPANEIHLEGHPKSSDILDNIAKLNILRSAGAVYPKYPLELGIAFVINVHNLAELKELPSFILKYHVNHVNVSHMKSSEPESENSLLYKRTLGMKRGSSKAKLPIVNLPYMDFDRDDVKSTLNDLFSSMNFMPHIGNIPMPRRTQYCRFIEEGMTFIRSDGNVSPCMELLHNGKSALGEMQRTVHHHSFGNVGANSLEEIWNSEEYTNFRKKVKEFSFSPCTYCGHCSDSESNLQDCRGNTKPCCGACLWTEGLFSCP